MVQDSPAYLSVTHSDRWDHSGIVPRFDRDGLTNVELPNGAAYTETGFRKNCHAALDGQAPRASAKVGDLLKRQLWAVDSMASQPTLFCPQSPAASNSRNAARHPSLPACRENLKSQWYDLQFERGNAAVTSADPHGFRKLDSVTGTRRTGSKAGMDSTESKALQFQEGSEAIDRLLEDIRRSTAAARHEYRNSESSSRQQTDANRSQRKALSRMDRTNHRDPSKRVEAKLAQRQRSLAEGVPTDDAVQEPPPMQQVDIRHGNGREQVLMVDVHTLQSRCQQLNSGATATSLLELQRRRGTQNLRRPQLAAAARSTFMKASNSAPALNTAMASQQGEWN